MHGDHELSNRILSAQQGDRGAFDVVVAHYRRASLALARQILPPDLAEDAVQDAFLTAFRALPKLQSPARFGPWLAAIVRHRCYRMSRHYRDRNESGFSEVSIDVPLVADDPLMGLIAEEMLQALPDGIREVAELHYLDGWSLGEIASFLVRPVSTLKWQLYAGRALLRRKYAKENPHEPH